MTRYYIECVHCGTVTTDGLPTDENWFGNGTAAAYYAGWHDRHAHSEESLDRQLSGPVQRDD